jgi:Recombination endonuclease VII
MDGSKTCSVCGETKPLAEFGRSARGVGGRRSQCKQCNAAAVKSRYVPRVHRPEQVVCPQCGQEFTRIRTVGALRIYCSRKCTFAAGEERKLKRNADLGPRRCACGAEVTTRVGKPVCPSCRKDPRGTEQLRAKERRRTLARYGLSEEQWDHLVTVQNNRCAICKTTQPGGKGESWHIDHDAATGVVRGLLCHNCNVGIGNLRHDPEIMMAAARYVAAHRSDAAAMPGRSRRVVSFAD